mmetsp:Transcript_12748/g.25965  ORF Transcript_12748/g.25965 Transcript_12748/m.25965 type:complete len:390 (-) Transcript_12748:17-1186(-)
MNAPDVVNLLKGHPNGALLPRDAMKSAMVALRDSGSLGDSLNYGDERGSPRVLQALADFITSSTALDDSPSSSCSPTSLFITSGISHSLELLCRALNPSTVMMESPSYFLAAEIFKSNGATMSPPPPMDRLEGGIDFDELEKLLINKVISPPCILYLIPTNHNPTGFTYSRMRREKLMRIAQTYNIIIIADEVYHLLDWRSSDTLKPGRMVVTEGAVPSLTISLSSFTKIFSPGLRLGWIECKDGSIISKIEELGYIQSQGGVAPFTSELMRVILKENLLLPHLSFIKATLKSRCDAILSKLALYKDAISVPFPPTGGYFLWLKLHNIKDESAFVRALKEDHNIIVLPGSSCCSPSAILDGVFIRICFACIDDKLLLEGVEKLCEVLRT